MDANGEHFVQFSFPRNPSQHHSTMPAACLGWVDELGTTGGTTARAHKPPVPPLFTQQNGFVTAVRVGEGYRLASMKFGSSFSSWQRFRTYGFFTVPSIAATHIVLTLLNFCASAGIDFWMSAAAQTPIRLGASPA